MSDFPSDRRYTNDHEWARAEGPRVTVGITTFAVEQLGDITLVSLTVKPGSKLTKGKDFGVVESVKTVSDLYAPVSGTVVAVNAELSQRPEVVNESPYDKGWMVVIETESSSDYDGLMDTAAYTASVQGH